jgi:hypothetical protein
MGNEQKITAWALLRGAKQNLIRHPFIFHPFLIIAFISLFLLELLVFSVRFPLNRVFEPFIVWKWGELYLHYPFNFRIITQMFQWIQAGLYIMINSFFIAAAIATIARINNQEDGPQGAAFRDVSVWKYLNAALASGLYYFVYMSLFTGLYGMILKRADMIRSTSGIFYILKQVTLQATPYVNFLSSVFVLTLFAYLIPSIVIDGKNIFSGLIENFRKLWKSFWKTFFVILIPSLIYVPTLLMLHYIQLIVRFTWPEMYIVVLAIGVVAVIFIDAFIYTALTSYYLIKREKRQ